MMNAHLLHLLTASCFTAYVGHIKFLGELYKRDVVKLAIMMYCLDELLKDEEDEENLECFAHLMTTMGEKLDGHAKQNNKPFDWDKVVSLRNSSKISNRIKFLLQDLLDLKDNRKLILHPVFEPVHWCDTVCLTSCCLFS